MPLQPVSGPAQRLWRPLLALLLAFGVILPLALHGPSCGHDFGFHMQSWMDAGQQLRHGDLLPRWAFSPAFNAGEPRFIFYPPLSWMLGSLLLIVFPSAAVPAIYTWLCLAGAALAMYLLALRFASANAALLASAVYLANPYLLFTAFERTAYAELLAAVWMPLLFAAALADRLSPRAIAVPLALLWLTNAPAAVMGTYAFVLLASVRLGAEWYRRRREAHPLPWQALVAPLGGLGLGLGLAGFYLVPAAWERRYVQIAMAIIPNMRVEDNFLFGHTGYGPHDQVLHTASVVALALAGLTLLALLLAWARQRSSAAPAAGLRALLPLSLIAAAILVLQFHFTLPLWHTLPELAFLQFPWRFMSVLGCVLGLAAALALRRCPAPLAVAVALALAVGAGCIGIVSFREGCEAHTLPAERVALFAAHHGVGPTDEYTPGDADNDQLRWDDPPYWLTTQLNAPGPHTVPNPAATIVDYDEPPPLDQTVSGRAPLHLQLRLGTPQELVLNLRDYPAWSVSVNGNRHPARLQRDDGLLALALPAGQDIVTVRWRTLPDVWVGDGLTLASLLAFGWIGSRSRRIEA